jgi:putative nucleotidyltransferase with HDIG domain
MEELESLYNLSEHVSHSLDLSETLTNITKLAVDITHTDACSLRLLNPDTNELEIMAATGVGPGYKNKGSLKIGEGVGGYVAKEGVAVMIPNLTEDKRIKYTSYLDNEGLMSLVSVPIKDEEESVIGIISVYKRQEYSFPQSIVNLLSTFANNTAVTIKNARLFETITRNYSDTIQSLALALEAKDKYTRGHSERVTDFALQIAKELGLTESELYTLRFAGKLHDIGKIAISDNILLKEDKLTLAEYADIKTHPQRGADLLKPLQFLQETCNVIKHHHERFDGKGYPDGLTANAIPLLSRILAVADAFDAMTSERPYRAPLSEKQALKETIACSGTQFDPEIVKAFEKIINKSYA